MKNTFKILGTVAVVAVIVFSLTACVIDDNGDIAIETVTGTFELNGNEITFSFPGDNMDGLTATFDDSIGTITISGLTDGGEFLNGTYTRIGSGSGIDGAFTRTIEGVIITFAFSINGSVTVTIIGGDSDSGDSDSGGSNIPQGQLSVSNIPSQYVGGSHYLYVQGLTIGGGNDSGRIFSGILQGKNITTTPINGTTVVLPLNWRSGTTGNETLDVYIFITTDTNVSDSGSGRPVNIVEQRFSQLTFNGRNASVEWFEW